MKDTSLVVTDVISSVPVSMDVIMTQSHSTQSSDFAGSGFTDHCTNGLEISSLYAMQVDQLGKAVPTSDSVADNSDQMADYICGDIGGCGAVDITPDPPSIRQTKLEHRCLLLIRRLRTLQARLFRGQLASQLQSAPPVSGSSPVVSQLQTDPTQSGAMFAGPAAEQSSRGRLSADGGVVCATLSDEQRSVATHQFGSFGDVLDPELTETSCDSGSEAGECALPSTGADTRFHSLDRWVKDRVKFASHWTWICAQINDLDFRVQQLSTLHSHLKTIRYSSRRYSTLDESGVQDGDSSARVRPLTALQRRRVVSLMDTAAARPPVSLAVCALCDSPRDECVCCRAAALPGPLAADQLDEAARRLPCCRWLDSAVWRRSYLYPNVRPAAGGYVGYSSGSASAELKGPAPEHPHPDKARPLADSRCLDSLKDDVFDDGNTFLSRFRRFSSDELRSGSTSETESQLSGSHSPLLHLPLDQSGDTADHVDTGRHWRYRRSYYDIDNIVIPPGVAIAGRIERLQYKDIATPGWRCVSSPQDMPVLDTAMATQSDGDGSVEDLSDLTFERRHRSLAVSERRRLVQSIGTSPITALVWESAGVGELGPSSACTETVHQRRCSCSSYSWFLRLEKQVKSYMHINRDRWGHGFVFNKGLKDRCARQGNLIAIPAAKVNPKYEVRTFPLSDEAYLEVLPSREPPRLDSTGETVRQSAGDQLSDDDVHLDDTEVRRGQDESAEESIRCLSAGSAAADVPFPVECPAEGGGGPCGTRPVST